MSARSILRAATAADHARVDQLFSTLDLSQPEDYGRFLLAQAEAHLAVEAALDRFGAEDVVPDWPERKRGDRLLADLEDLQLSPPDAAAPLDLESAGAVLGAVYVLEGSRLGGAVLRRSLAPDAPRRFLTAPQSPGAWPKSLETLDEKLAGSVQADAAVHSARAVFALFESAGRRHLEFGTA